MTDDSVGANTATAARAKVQWDNHLLDWSPHDAQLWFDKALHFDEAMAEVI